ncbi:hypothetical protein PROH_05045 [Prochlorothrix hollandica PCC 9006 = CALU 1027]|uniref:Uncharacterized protein n=1 Tax=Prochlorothrix hollandica PCC 9006 = CALU 1027 TaxID=317619 RepID=A0A0M2PWW6_PROHO|nr:hypothetical protein PROH_05045 [Prochlorothrix hollandica PCC 9006 = CALU 1027]
MLFPFLFARIENRNNLLSIWINASYKVVSPLVATTTGKCEIIKFIRTTQRFWNDMINGKLIGTQSLR